MNIFRAATITTRYYCALTLMHGCALFGGNLLLLRCIFSVGLAFRSGVIVVSFSWKMVPFFGVEYRCFWAKNARMVPK